MACACVWSCSAVLYGWKSLPLSEGSSGWGSSSKDDNIVGGSAWHNTDRRGVRCAAPCVRGVSSWTWQRLGPETGARDLPLCAYHVVHRPLAPGPWGHQAAARAGVGRRRSVTPARQSARGGWSTRLGPWFAPKSWTVHQKLWIRKL
jgi:hypothetical protein